jgi:hypothetical protein
MIDKVEDFRILTPEGDALPLKNNSGKSTFGIKWRYQGDEHVMDCGYAIQAVPLPESDGFLIVYPYFHKAPMNPPDNAAIYNADGTLRFRLKAPNPLSRHWPGYVHTPEQIEKSAPEGFWQVGWGCGDGITDIYRPWMWANIGLHCDVYERRYFDPKTGEFDLEHYSTARR